MKKITYIALILGLSSLGAANADNLTSSIHNHSFTSNQTVIAHSGGTNSDGCHNDHKKGTYHCH